MSRLAWELLKKRKLLKEPYIEVERRIYSNKSSIEDYSIVTFSQKNTVMIVALTPGEDVLLLRQYRPAADQLVVNLPGGRVEEDETSEDAAVRELKEETGHSTDSRNFSRIYEGFQNPTRVTDKSFIFLATDVKKTAEEELDQTEKNSEMFLVNFEEIAKLLSYRIGEIDARYLRPKALKDTTVKLKRGDISDATTVLALLLANKKLEK